MEIKNICVTIGNESVIDFTKRKFEYEITIDIKIYILFNSNFSIKKHKSKL